MLQSIWEDVKREFSYGNMITRIILANLGVFIFFVLVRVFLPPEVSGGFIKYFMVSSDWKELLFRPWTLLTSMFLHLGVFHILFNMLILYWFGRIVGDFIGNQRVLPIYLLGGLVGALVFFISANLLPYGADGTHYALGASAGVMAIVASAGIIAPDYIMRLLIIGDVKLKFIVLALIVLDLLAIANNNNAGGSFAHLGGVALGFFLTRQLQDGNDWTRPVNNFLDSIFDFFQNLFSGNRPPKGPRPVYKNPRPKATKAARSGRGQAAPPDAGRSDDHQNRLDTILDKIKDSGYDSLSEEEKEFLFNASKK